MGILDILATLNDDTLVNIEIQVKDYYNTIERSLFYGTGVYHYSLKSGEDYTEIQNSISIWITNYNVFEKGPFHEIVRLKRDYDNITLTNKLELHYIQLPKFKQKCKRISNKLEDWLTFIINENMEAIHMSQNENIKKAEKELQYLTGDEEARRLAYLRQKAIMDEVSGMSSMRKKGLEEGLEKGVKQGKKEEKIKIAKKLLEKKMDIEEIAQITGLTKEEIKEL